MGLGWLIYFFCMLKVPDCHKKPKERNEVEVDIPQAALKKHHAHTSNQQPSPICHLPFPDSQVSLSIFSIVATNIHQFVGATEFTPNGIADSDSIPSQGQVKLRLRRPQWRRVELAPKGQKLGLALTRRQETQKRIPSGYFT